MSDADYLVMNRSFSAPVEKVLAAWSEQEQFAKWYGPESFEIPVCELDFKVGGKRKFCMDNNNGMQAWLGGEYLEITDTGFKATEYMADENGNEIDMSAQGMHAMNVIVNLSATDSGCDMELKFGPIPAGPMRDQSESGFNQAFVKLDKFLAA